MVRGRSHTLNTQGIILDSDPRLGFNTTEIGHDMLTGPASLIRSLAARFSTMRLKTIAR
jgi:hypothetical protein